MLYMTARLGLEMPRPARAPNCAMVGQARWWESWVQPATHPGMNKAGFVEFSAAKNTNNCCTGRVLAGRKCPCSVRFCDLSYYDSIVRYASPRPRLPWNALQRGCHY